MIPIWSSGPTRRCPTWASSCLATLWCWRGGACSTHLSHWPTAARTPSWRPWLCPVWPSGRSHTPAVSSHTHTDRGDKCMNSKWIPNLSRWDSEQSVCRRRCEPRLRPGGSTSLVGVCDGARGGERALPVSAALSYRCGSCRTSVTATQEEVWTPLFGFYYFFCYFIFVANIYRICNIWSFCSSNHCLRQVFWLF